MKHFKYFFREIGKSEWKGCNKNIFDIQEKSLEHETKRVEFGACAKHGEFEFKKTSYRSKAVIASVCPSCAIDNHLSNNQSLEVQKEIQSGNAELKMRKIGITKRLMHLGFDDFIADTPEKHHALSRCKAVADDILKGIQTPSLILSGGVGTGKTLLACSIAKAIMAKSSVRIITATDLFQEIKDSWGKDSDKNEKQVVNYYGRLDLLIIDEIGVGTNSEFESNTLFRFIKNRNDEMKPTILISNLGSDEFRECVDKRTRDRLREDGGKMVSFDWESYRK